MLTVSLCHPRILIVISILVCSIMVRFSSFMFLIHFLDHLTPTFSDDMEPERYEKRAEISGETGRELSPTKGTEIAVYHLSNPSFLPCSRFTFFSSLTSLRSARRWKREPYGTRHERGSERENGVRNRVSETKKQI